MKRPCYCGRAIKGAPLDKFDDSVPEVQKQCVTCWNALNDPFYQRLWGIAGKDVVPLTPEQIAALQKGRSCC